MRDYGKRTYTQLHTEYPEYCTGCEKLLSVVEYDVDWSAEARERLGYPFNHIGEYPRLVCETCEEKE